MQGKLDTIQSKSHESSENQNKSVIHTSTLPSASSRFHAFSGQMDSERGKFINSASLKPGPKLNHSVENTPASRLNNLSASGTNNNNNNPNDNISRRERSLSAFTDESYEPCGFMDYYKAYKKENNIPPSELGDSEGSSHLRPPVFGLGLSRRNTIDPNTHANTSGFMQKSKEIDAISEQYEEVIFS